MKERDQSRVASILTLLLGIWIAISPIWLSASGGALVSMIAMGSVIGVFSIIQYFWENSFPSWIMGLAAIWLFISTFVFGAVSSGAILSNILSAIATFVLACWDGAEVAQVSTHRHVTAS